jgi:hypothetical protein
MAERRMFAKTIIDSDAFLDMPMSTQCLYFHLAMRADDEGFLNNPKKVQRMVGASEDDLKILLSKRFILAFESGVIVIKHWKIHNYIRGDRIVKTAYKEERALLDVKENGAYTEHRACDNHLPDTCPSDDSQVPDMCPPDDSKAAAQDRLGEVSIGEVSTGKGNACAARTATQIAEETMKDWSEELQTAVRDWLAYKKEKRQPYKETGLKSLMTQIRKAADEYGDGSVCEIIRTSMSSNYQGIVFDRLQKERRRSPAYMSTGKQQPLSADDWEKVMASI